VLNSHRAMRCTLYVVSIFELVLGIWYFGIGVAFYSGIEDRGAIEHVYYGFGAGAAAFVASAMGFITFGALFYTAHKEVFLNHVVPVALRQRGMCRCSCRVLGVLMVLILVQFMLMGWGLGTVLAAFGDEAADGDGADTIGGNEALALCDICGRILYFIVMLMVCIRFANLWANTVRAWMKAGDLNSGSPMKKVFTHGHYNEDLEQQFASAMAERASEADPSAADGSYVPVGDGGSAGNKRRSHPRELNLAAAAFGVASPASTASTPSFALAPAHVEDAEFIDLWNTLPPSGEFRLPVGVAPSFTPQLLSQHLSDQVRSHVRHAVSCLYQHNFVVTIPLHRCHSRCGVAWRCLAARISTSLAKALWMVL